MIADERMQMITDKRLKSQILYKSRYVIVFRFI
jgi:hypothetical protein